MTALASESASSFPRMPTWEGTQQKETDFDLKDSLYSNSLNSLNDRMLRVISFNSQQSTIGVGIYDEFMSLGDINFL